MIAELARCVWRGLVHPQRKPIPEAVKAAVWRRDRGRCVKCGTTADLEYAHVVAWIKGGDDSAGNLRLLCRRHNLAEGARVPLGHQLLRWGQWLAVLTALAAAVGSGAALVHPAPAWAVHAWRAMWP